jgi:hypothetical protein
MDSDEFRRLVFADRELGETVREAARAGRPQQYSVVTEAMVIALMFPIVAYVVKNIGLPWLYELKRYSELQRSRVHQWIDERHRDEGFDPDAAEAASDALLEKLESTTNQTARAAWQRLAELLKEEG